MVNRTGLAAWCDWRPTPDEAHVCLSSDEASAPNLSSNEFEACAKRARVWSCRSSQRSGLLVGPLSAMPGDWTSIWMGGWAGKHLLAAHDRIVAYTGDAVDEDGEPIPYPPFHVHHLHIEHGPHAFPIASSFTPGCSNKTAT